MSLVGCAPTTSEPTIVRPESASQTTLDNGLNVIWQVDQRQPLIAIEARIIGGLRQEGRYLGSGITHFLEHMLFKGTTSRAPGMIDQEVRRYGGTINAFTSHDSTGVNLFVESKYLPEALGLLADILQNAIFPPEEFEKERQVVISEIQMNKDDPDRRIRDLFWGTHFLMHPYRHPILGYQSRLEQLTVDDMRNFYKAQYVPNNIIISCVGDVDPKTFPALVRQTFGAWPRGAPYLVVVPDEPPPVSVRERRDHMAVQAAYSLVGFPSVALSHPDLYALDVLASVIGQGRSSRLHETIVRKKRLADAIGAGNYTPQDPGAFTISFRTSPGGIQPAVEAVLDVVEQVRRTGITEHELQKAKRQVVASFVFHRQTVESKADDLANSAASTGDPMFSARYVEGVERVTADQVRQVAANYLDRTRMTLVTIEPEGTEVEAKPVITGQPTVTKTALPNGATMLVGVEKQLPMAVVVAVMRGGVRAETDANQGVSNLTAQLLTKGTNGRSASEIASTIESLGGSLEAFSGRDSFGVVLQVLSEDLDEGLSLVHEVLTESTFPEDELALQKQLVLKELEARDDDVFDISSRLLRKTLFESHPYRFDPMGSKDTVSTLTRKDCQDFVKQYVVPGNLVLAVFGDLDESHVRQQAQRRFGTMVKAEAPWPPSLASETLDRIREASVTLPKEQSVIMMGFRGTRVSAVDRDTVDVLTAILSGMSGRLFQSVREKQGLAYALGATNVPGWDPGHLVVYAATRPDEREAVMTTIKQQLQLMVAAGVTDEELALAKQYLIGSHRMDVQHLGGLAKRCALDELYGLGANAWTQYEVRINAVTAAAVQEAAGKYLTLPQRAQVIVGPNGAESH